ncbi:hypothetical protein HRED_10612 [Candidatus Haloredivivus sp. G17]|nr:hypothetical protein HRED_10612 [Candidatus Haloredivivus sp. G17]
MNLAQLSVQGLQAKDLEIPREDTIREAALENENQLTVYSRGWCN